MDIFEEIPWFQFKLIPSIKKLPLQEQVIKYNVYMADLHHRRAVWHTLMHEGKGTSIQIIGVLLQEDLFDLLQEDGSQILITGLA